VRYFHSNLNLGPHIEIQAFENPEKKYAVLGVHGGRHGEIRRGMATYEFEEMCELQGFPPDMEIPFFTRQKAREAVGNAVPVMMAEAIAKAVRKATGSNPVSASKDKGE
jgi:site-specific DNA-cytosine methylase